MFVSCINYILCAISIGWIYIAYWFIVTLLLLDVPSPSLPALPPCLSVRPRENSG